MSAGAVTYRVEGGVAHVTFDRPQARNAMTWAMYEGLKDACAAIAAAPDVRCAVLRGAGGQAFIAGTDIAQFDAFNSAQDGIDYERQMEVYLSALEAVRVPTVAVVEGWAIGGGLAIVSACDLRIATPGSRFGVPIARTLGNCLSVRNYARLVTNFGVPRVKRMLLLAETIDADEASDCGFLTDIVPPDELDARVADICTRLSQHAPITMRTAKEALRRLQDTDIPDGEDLIAETYGSRDFRIGLEAFIAKTKPRWEGR